MSSIQLLNFKKVEIGVAIFRTQNKSFSYVLNHHFHLRRLDYRNRAINSRSVAEAALE